MPVDLLQSTGQSKDLLEGQPTDLLARQKVESGVSPIAKLARLLTRSSLLKQLDTTQYIHDNKEKIPQPNFGESFSDYHKRFKTDLGLEKREEDIAKQGTVAQFDDVMTAGVAGGLMTAPAHTAKILAAFGGLEGLAELTGINKRIEKIPNATLKDVVDIAKFGLMGVVAGGAAKVGRRAKLNMEAAAEGKPVEVKAAAEELVSKAMEETTQPEQTSKVDITKSYTPEEFHTLPLEQQQLIRDSKMKEAKSSTHRQSIEKKYAVEELTQLDLFEQQPQPKVEVNRDIKSPTSTVDPTTTSPSIVSTVSPNPPPPSKPLPLSAYTPKDYLDTSLVNKMDKSTERLVGKMNDRLRGKMESAITDYQKGKNPYTLNPIVDTTDAFQRLEEKTAFPLYSKYYTQGMRARNEVAYQVTTLVNKFTEGLKKGFQTAESTERIVKWITEGKVSLNSEEKLIATKLQDTFRQMKDTVSYLRMRRFIDGAEKVPADFEKMVMEGEAVFVKEGREGLEKWVKGKDFGVVKDDRYFPAQLLYKFRTHISEDPFEVFNPYTHSREAGNQLYDYSQSLTQKLHSYLTRVYTDYYMYDLLTDAKNDLSLTTIPFDTLQGMRRWFVALQGKGTDVGWWGEQARKTRGQFFKTVLGDPTKMLRNYFQRYYLNLQYYPTLQHPSRYAKYREYKLTDGERDFFNKHVSELGELEREQLYIYDKYFSKGALGKLDTLATKLAHLYTLVDQGNRYSVFKYALAGNDPYLRLYKNGKLSLDGLMSKTGMSSFYDLETKHILSLPIEEARLEIAKLMVEKTQMRYKKVERGIGALSELGEVSTSLFQYPKSVITRFLDAGDMVLHGNTVQEQWDGVRILFETVLLAKASYWLLTEIAGESRYYDPVLKREVVNDPYAIDGIIGGLGIGGAQAAHSIQVGNVIHKLWGLSKYGDEMSEKERLSSIRGVLKDVDQLGEAYIPFLKMSMNVVEAAENTRTHKLLTTWFDQRTNRQTALKKNKIQRDWINQVRHAITGLEEKKK